MRTCERCGAAPTQTAEGLSLIHDYCANCSRDLCEECMAQGCCGKVPAESGMEADFPPDDGFEEMVERSYGGDHEADERA